MEETETDVEYNLEVKVSSNRSKQEDTSDDNEPEDAYSNELLADENMFAQNGAERQKEQELNSLALSRPVQGLKSRFVPCFFYNVLPQV